MGIPIRPPARYMQEQATSIPEEDPFKSLIMSPMGFAIAVSLFLGILEVPYRAVSIPQEVMISLGGLSAVFIAWLVMENFLLVPVIFVCFIPFTRVLPGDFGGVLTGFNLTNILLLAMLIGSVLRNMMGGVQKNATPRPKSMMNWFVISFLFLSLISSIRAGFHGNASIFNIIISAKRWATPIFIYFLFLHSIKERRELVELVKVLMLSSAIIGLIGLKQFYVDGSRGGTWDDVRIGVISDQPNIMGSFYAYYTMYFFTFAIEYADIRKTSLLLFVPFLCNIRAWMLTVSRGAQLAFVVGFLVYVSFRSRWMLAATVVVLAIVVAIPGLIPETISSRWIEIFEVPENEVMTNEILYESLDKSGYGRFTIWESAYEMIQDNLLLGVGLGRFPQEVRAYLPGKYVGYDAHNGYILIASEMGVLALVAFVGLILCAMYNAVVVYVNSKEDRFMRAFSSAFIVGLVAVLVANLTGGRLFTEELSGWTWVLFALIIRARMFVTQKNEEDVLEENPSIMSLAARNIARGKRIKSYEEASSHRIKRRN